MLRSGRSDDMPFSIDGGHHRSAEQLDPVCLVVAGVLDPVRLIPLAEEQSLGQWWALVRQVVLRANQQHLAIEAPLTQPDRRGSAAKRGTDDDNAGRSWSHGSHRPRLAPRSQGRRRSLAHVDRQMRRQLGCQRLEL